MIVVDTSAIIAMAQEEQDADRCATALLSADRLLMSAGTMLELLVVAAGRRIEAQAESLLDGLDLEIVPVTKASARASAEAYRRWGKGCHPAALNFGDCFAYALARDRDCPLLFVGNDFARTDVRAGAGVRMAVAPGPTTL